MCFSGVTVFGGSGVSIFWVGVDIFSNVARTRCIRFRLSSFTFLLILSCCFSGFYNSYHNVIQEL